ncbi:MAG TPA: c-type cytochrome [Rhizomicrobium sp.]|nr:c-type cytochrome [Rhizomicrobium sp.]
MRWARSVLKGAALGAVFLGSPVSAADPAHGKLLFAACIACHSETADAQGPSLKGVTGRKAGSLEDFRYSSAMKRADFSWDATNLRDYLHDPQAKVNGNHMPFSGFASMRDAEDVAAYLETYK